MKLLACLDVVQVETYIGGMKNIGILSDPKNRFQIFDALKELHIHFYGGN